MTALPNIPVTDRVAVAAAINPQSGAVGTLVSGWISMADFGRVAALIQTGVLGAAATVDAKIQQATSAAGAGAKDITGKAITQIVKASGDNKQAWINVSSQDLDANGGFTHVQLSITIAAAASLVSGVLFGADARYGSPASADAASVVQIV